MNWLESNTPSRLRLVSECRGFVIAADNPSDGHMPWWIAKRSSGKEIAAGYGDDGLAKCKRFCQLAIDNDEQPAERVALNEISVPKSFVCEPATQPEPKPSLF